MRKGRESVRRIRGVSAGADFYDLSPQSLARWCDGTWLNGLPAVIREVSHDTRTLQDGDLFIALPGSRYDGHDYLEEAYQRGASGAIVNRTRAGAIRLPLPLLAVEDTREALRRMAWGHRRSLSSLVIGVSGSVGKTTVKEMIAGILESVGPTVRSPASWNNEIGLPLSLLKLRRRHRYGVFEVGINRPGEMEDLASLLAPDWAVVTCVGPVHLEFLGSVEEVARQKRRLVEAIRNGGKVFLDRDHEWFEYLRGRTRAEVVTVSARGDRRADYWVEARNGGHDFFVHEQDTGESYRYSLGLPGEHILRDALLAIAVGRRAGVPARVIAGALGSFESPAMRWEVTLRRGVIFVNDAYNANPLSMRAAIEAFARSYTGRRWLVLGGMRELGAYAEEEHRRLGEFVARDGWAGVLLVGELARLIRAGVPAESGLRVVLCRDQREAAEVLGEELRPGDSVLLKGSRAERMEEVLRHWEQRQAGGSGEGKGRTGAGN